MKKRLIIIGCVLMLLVGATFALGGLNDRFSGINLTSDNYIELPQIAAPAGNPKNNTGWLYVKDSAGTTKLYFEDDAGSVTDLMASSATLWSNIGNPTAAKTITFGTYATILTSAKTDGDMFTIRGTGDFGDVSVLRVEQITGNPTNGTVLEVVSADTDCDPLVVASSAGTRLQVYGNGNVDITGGTGAINYTDFTVSADGVIQITPDDSPAACMTIAPSAAATTGLVVSSANLTNAIDIGAKKILGTTGVIDFTNFDVSGAGAVTCVSLDSGSGTIVTTGAVNGGSLTITGAANIGIWKQDAVVPAGGAGTTITVNGNGAGGVTIGGTSTGAITLGGGATSVVLPAATDLTLSGGTITGTDTGTGPMLSLTNNTLTNSNLVTLSATAMTSGKGVSFTGGAAVSGDCFYAQATDAGMTGNYFRAYDAANDVFTVKRYGATTIRGNAATDVLTLTAGNLQVTAGNVDVDNGNLTVDTAQDLASNISRNFAGAGGAALLTVAEQNANSTSTALAVTNAGTAASTGVSIAHSGDNPTLALTAGAARTGDVINIAMANQLGQRALNITGAITSVAGGGVIEVHATGVIPATASLLRLDADTAQPGDGDGWMLNVDDDTLVVATPKKYAVLINSANNEALHVASGESLFAEVATFTAGVAINADLLATFSANTEEALITTTATDYAAGSGILTVFADGAGATNNTYLLRLVNKTDADAQDHFILCQDNSTGAAGNGDEKFAVDMNGVVRAAGGVAPGPTTTSALKSTTVTLTNANIKALRATPITLVAAPGAGYYLELVSATLILNYGTNVLTCGAADDLVVQYGTTGVDVTASIETTGFIDQAADQVSHHKGITIASNTAANVANRLLELFNTGGAEIAGNAGNDTTMNVVVTYWVHATGL